jgi:hypothetical protein
MEILSRGFISRHADNRLDNSYNVFYCQIIKEMGEKSIKKLGKISGLFHWTNLYALEDHLLIEKVVGYSAEYRRFFYDDIISILTYKHPNWKIKVLLDCILAAITIFIIFQLLLFKSPFYFILITLFISSPFWHFLIFDLLFGPTSKGQIRTLTSTEDIVLAKRYRKSKKVLQKLQGLIEDCQGIVANESLYGRPLEYSSPLLSPTKIIRENKQKGAIPTSKYNTLYSFFLVLLFLEVIVSSFQFMFPGDISILLSSFSLMVIIVNIIVLFKQKRLYIRKPLQILSWISLIVFLSFIVVAFILGFFLAFDYLIMGKTHFIQTDPRFLTMKIIYLGLESLLVFFGIVISMKGHHSVYSTQ